MSTVFVVPQYINTMSAEEVTSILCSFIYRRDGRQSIQ